MWYNVKVFFEENLERRKNYKFVTINKAFKKGNNNMFGKIFTKKAKASRDEVNRLLDLTPEWIECPNCGEKHLWQGEKMSHYCKMNDGYGWSCEACGSRAWICIDDKVVLVELNKLHMRASRKSIRAVGNNKLTVRVNGWLHNGSTNATMTIKMK